MAKHNLGEVPLYHVWPHCRDNTRGTTPYAVEQLAKCRTYTPPSKAHVKRLLKLRPKYGIATPPPAPCPRGQAERRATNEAMAVARPIIALLKRISE